MPSSTVLGRTRKSPAAKNGGPMCSRTLALASAIGAPISPSSAHYRLADEKREIILVACSKCDWRAAFERDELITAHGADYVMPNLLNYLAARIAVGSALNGIAAACTTSSPSKRANANLLG